MSDKLNIQTNFKHISWSWLPSPHISLSNATVADKKLSAKFSKAKIYPDWVGLFTGNPGIKKVEIDAPEVHVKALHFSENQKYKPRTFPSSLIVIKDARFFVPPLAAAKKLSETEPHLELSHIDATIRLEQSGILIDIAWNPEFAKSLLLKCHYQPSMSNKHSNIDSKLQLNSEAIELDLTQIREKVLFLFGSNDITRKVCSIVQGGYAKKASFSFNGNSKDIKKLNAMTITADAEKAIIDIPKINLHLKDGSGAIKIQDGILSGENLSAKLGTSSGTNGAITLGLVGKEKVFKLAVDVDADIAELPSVLHKVVRSERFRSELNYFSNTRGWASGKLVLGDTLKELSVEIELYDAEACTDYQRLLFPVRVNKIWLKILPKGKMIHFKKIKGSSGPHMIHASTGSVQWKDNVLIDIEKLRATIDSNELFKELNFYPPLQKTLSKIITSIDGTVEITDLQLKGLAIDPLSWEYTASILTKDLRFNSLFFNRIAHLDSATLQVLHNNIQIAQCRIKLSEQMLDFKGNFDHAKWQNWKGSLELTGVFTPEDAKWLRSKQWIPPKYFPYTPCKMSSLKVAFDENKTVEIQGEIISEKYPHEPVHTKIEFKKSPEEILVKNLTITSPKETSIFSFYFNRSHKKQLFLDFKGFLNANTLNSVFEDNKLLKGYITGNCNLKYSIGGSDSPQISGPLAVTDFTWETGPGNIIRINYAKIDGHGSTSDIQNLSLSLNDESFVTKGKISLTHNGAELNLDANSDALSFENISMFLKPKKKRSIAKNTMSTSQSPTKSQPNGSSESTEFSLTGSIDFTVNTLKYKRASNTKSNKSTDYIWHGLTGRMNFLPDKKISIPITSGDICGFETTGTIHLDPDLNNLFISIRPNGEQKFRKVFSCLGINFRKIKGRFALNANLEGVPGDWQKGSIELKSKDGQIKGMTLLTRILSVVNVTDLFSKNAAQDFFTGGFFYSDMVFKGTIKDNVLIIDKARIKGKGMNLFGSGKIDLKKMEVDFVVLVAPFKVLDATISKLLTLGFIKETEDNVIITVPIGVKGPIKDPKVTPLPVTAVGEGMLNFVKNALILPFKIFKPIIPK